MSKQHHMEVTRYGTFDMQVCVPAHFTDYQVIAFAEMQYPCGTSAGWQIVKEGSKWLGPDPERNPCKEHPANVHITLQA